MSRSGAEDGRPSSRASGRNEESRAARFLEEKGWTVLEKNFRWRRGEIDLIAEDPQGTLIFAEVKFRSTAAFGTGAEAVGLRKQKRIVQTALLYLQNKGWEKRACRFDVIALEPDRVDHIPNAFPAQGGTL